MCIRDRFNPFSQEHLLAALPKTVKKIAVLDRCKEMGAAGEPLYLAVCAAFANREDRPYLCGGRYGLSSKDTTPAQIKAVFDHLLCEQPAGEFTVGIEDDVTGLSIPVEDVYKRQRNTLCTGKPAVSPPFGRSNSAWCPAGAASAAAASAL